MAMKCKQQSADCCKYAILTCVRQSPFNQPLHLAVQGQLVFTLLFSHHPKSLSEITDGADSNVRLRVMCCI